MKLVYVLMFIIDHMMSAETLSLSKKINHYHYQMIIDFWSLQGSILIFLFIHDLLTLHVKWELFTFID